MRQEASRIGKDSFEGPCSGAEGFKATGKVNSESNEKDPQYIAICLPTPPNNRLECEWDWLRLEIKIPVDL